MEKHRFIPHWHNIISYIRNPKTDWKPKVLLLISVIYLMLPFDFVPDFIPIVGWLDDIGIVSFAAMWFLKRVTQHEEKIHSQHVEMKKEDSLR
ncbi:DUF1232 domain-containing protein [Candidatus Uhrbacteria bacterium]|nr:DUF1232 domain-containing protein [Candidatus Uhrbacteria bacterium]